MEIPVPDLLFGKKQRGKLPDSNKIFRGSFGELDNFVPKNLSRRHVASKMASLNDLMDKYSPILAGLKLNLRKVTKNTIGWDEPMLAELRNKWVENFWKFEQLRGLQFNKARMLLDALDEKMRLLTILDGNIDGWSLGRFQETWCLLSGMNTWGELDGEIIAKGPFQIGGVGAMKTKAIDEWLLSVETTNAKSGMKMRTRNQFLLPSRSCSELFFSLGLLYKFVSFF